MHFPRLFTCLLALVVQAITATAAPLATHVFTHLEAGKPQVVEVYGTSLSALGVWARQTRDWFQKSYPHLVTYVNNSGSGKDSAWAVANLQSKVLDVKPDLIFIEFAYNDSFVTDAGKPHTGGVSLEVSAQNLDKMVTAIHAQNPSADVVLQIMNIPWDAPNNHGSATHRPHLVQFDDGYRHYAAEKNLPLIDHYPAWQALLQSDPDKYHLWVPDGTHPNRDGSLAVTWPAVKAFLEQSQATARASK